jgi:hypothetical protein
MPHSFHQSRQIPDFQVNQVHQGHLSGQMNPSIKGTN